VIRIPPTDHRIDIGKLSRGALSVVKQLRDADHQAFIVGGAVRDLILGGRPKDFDVATDATPEQVRALFRGARIVGRRFQIVHVRMGREIIEVTTFRGHHSQSTTQSRGSANSHQSDKGLLLRDNVYGTLEEDALRRDLTINALYYDPVSQEVLDQCAGVEDIYARKIAIIGNPAERYREDPVRMLRVVRFAAKLAFNIDPLTAAPVNSCGHLLRDIPPARLFDESLKLFMAGFAAPTLSLLSEFGLLGHLFPATAEAFSENERGRKVILGALEGTDQRVKDGRPVTPAFLFAAMLWPAVDYRAKQLSDRGEARHPALHSSGQQVVLETCQHLAIPKRFSLPMREIWELQSKLESRQSKRVKDVIARRRFRAAYDLLRLREGSGEPLEGLGDFWEKQQLKYPEIVGSQPAPETERPRNRRRGRRRPTS
jgi:poly(A) polymerase